MVLVYNIKAWIRRLPVVGYAILSYQHWRTSCLDSKNRALLQKYGVEIIANVQETLGEKCPWFVDFGTLLGIVRDGGFMKYDDDLDISVLMDGTFTPGKLLRTLLTHGFKYLSCYEYAGRIEQLAVTYRGLRVDFFLNRFVDDDWMCFREFSGEMGVDESGRRSLTCFETPRPRAKGWTLVGFRGLNLRVPANYEDLLAAEYGDNWRVPDPHWNPATDKKYPRRTMPGKGYCLVPAERVYELDR